MEQNYVMTLKVEESSYTYGSLLFSLNWIHWKNEHPMDPVDFNTHSLAKECVNEI